MANDRDLRTRRWQTYRQAALRTLPPVCYLCGKPIDTNLPGTHPDGPTLDHLTPRSRGGRTYDPTNIALAHNTCNNRKGNRTTNTTSRNW